MLISKRNSLMILFVSGGHSGAPRACDTLPTYPWGVSRNFFIKPHPLLAVSGVAAKIVGSK